MIPTSSTNSSTVEKKTSFANYKLLFVGPVLQFGPRNLGQFANLSLFYTMGVLVLLKLCGAPEN